MVHKISRHTKNATHLCCIELKQFTVGPSTNSGIDVPDKK